MEPAIEFMHLSDIGTMKLSQCTESQKVRVLIARLILLDCHTVFMIEPLRDLEEEAMRMVVSWMANEIEHGKRIISVSPSLKRSLPLSRSSLLSLRQALGSSIRKNRRTMRKEIPYCLTNCL